MPIVRKITDPGKYTHEGNKPEGDAPTKRVLTTEHLDATNIKSINSGEYTVVADKIVGIPIEVRDDEGRYYEVYDMVLKRGRGRPKGSTKKTLRERRKAMENPEGKLYTFRSPNNKCDCVFYSDIMGSAMFCKHKNPMMGRKI